MGWLARLRRQAARDWTAPPGSEPDAPLLDGAFLRRLEDLTLRVRRSGTTGFSGEHASRRKAHSVEFADYRNYTPGDDFRLIDWNVYARLGQLTLRLTEAAEATTLHLLLDCSGSMAWGTPAKFWGLQRLAAALGCVALTRYDNVSMGLLHGDSVQPLPLLRGKNEIGRFLTVLNGLHPGGPLDLAPAVQSYCAAPRRGVAILISDLLVEQGLSEALGYLHRAGLEPTVLQVLAPDDAAPQVEGPLDLVDCETGQIVTAAIDGAALRAYAERFAAWSATVEETCRAQQTTFLRLYTDQPLEDLVFGPLREQRVLL